MIRMPFVYHREDLLEIQFFKTTSEGQGSRVFGSREQTTRPPAVEKKFAFGGQVSPKVKLLAVKTIVSLGEFARRDAAEIFNRYVALQAWAGTPVPTLATSA